MMEGQMVDNRPVAPDDVVTDIDRPAWDPRSGDDDELTRRNPHDRGRSGEPQDAPGAPYPDDVDIDPSGEAADRQDDPIADGS